MSDWVTKWKEETLPVLKAVHGVAVARRMSGVSERSSLARLAELDGLRRVPTDSVGQQRGQLLYGAVVAAVRTAGADLDRPARDIVELWHLYLTTGQTLRQLAHTAPALGRGAGHDVEPAPGTLRYWLGLQKVDARHGHAAAIQAIVESVELLESRALIGEASDLAAFEHARVHLQKDPVGLALAKTLSVLADEPFDLALLESPSHRAALSQVLDDAMTNQRGRPLVAAVDRLQGLGIAERVSIGFGAGVRLRAGVRERLNGEMNAKELRSELDQAVRLLHLALPDNPVSPDTWTQWRQAYPHVLAVTNQFLRLKQADRRRIQLAGEVLAWAGIFTHYALDDRDAAQALIERGRDAMDRAGRPNREAYAAVLVNLSTVSEDRRATLALTREALSYRAGQLASQDTAYMGTRLAHANALKREGQFAVARREYLQLVSDVRSMEVSKDSTEMLVEALHDYASALLEEAGKRRADDSDLSEAVHLYEEVLMYVRPGEHGYWQTVTNWGDALVLLGQPSRAEQRLRELWADSTERYGEFSDAAFHALVTLLDITERTGAADFASLFAEARRLDRRRVADGR